MRRIPLIPAILAGVLALGILSAVLGGFEGESGDQPTSVEPARTEAPPSRCESVPASMVDVISEGLTVQGGGSISNAAAVRSEDFERLYFIAAEIEGPGLEGAGDIGVWASNRLEGGAGMLFSVDHIAREFSVYGSGGRTDASITMVDDGARAAVDCLEGG